jgi:hypothetical protein
LPYSYFRKCFKLVYTKSVVMVTLITGVMFLLTTCMHWNFTKVVRVLAFRAEVVRDCGNFEKHWCSLSVFEFKKTVKTCKHSLRLIILCFMQQLAQRLVTPLAFEI